MRWRSPPESRVPRSPGRVSYPSGMRMMKSCEPAEGARQRDALALSARKQSSALPGASVISLGHAHDEVVRTGGLGGGDDFFVGCVRVTVSDVLGDAGCEQHRFLQHNGELAAQVGNAVFANIFAIQQD